MTAFTTVNLVLVGLGETTMKLRQANNYWSEVQFWDRRAGPVF